MCLLVHMPVHICVCVMPVHVLALPTWVVHTQVHCSGACALPCPYMYLCEGSILWCAWTPTPELRLPVHV